MPNTKHVPYARCNRAWVGQNPAKEHLSLACPSSSPDTSHHR